MTSSEEISVDNVMIWNFYQILKTGDYKYLKEGATEKDWLKFYDEYFEVSKMRTPQWGDIVKFQRLVLKYSIVKGLLSMLTRPSSKYKECIEQLKKWGYKYNEKQTLIENIERLTTNLQVLGNKIEIQHQELPKETQEANLYKELAIFKKHKYDINPRETSCAYWIELKNQLQEDVRSNRGIN